MADATSLTQSSPGLSATLLSKCVIGLKDEKRKYKNTKYGETSNGRHTAQREKLLYLNDLILPSIINMHLDNKT